MIAAVAGIAAEARAAGIAHPELGFVIGRFLEGAVVVYVVTTQDSLR